MSGAASTPCCLKPGKCLRGCLHPANYYCHTPIYAAMSVIYGEGFKPRRTP